LNQNKKAFHPRGRRDRAEAPPPPPPPGLAARVAAAAALADILGAGHTLEERFAADAAAGRQLAFDVRDRALIRSIVATSLRRLGTIRAALAQFLDKGLPKKAGSLEHTLIVGAAQLMFLDVPDHAAVDLAVRAVRADPKAAPFAAVANAVLRNIARARDELREPADPFIDTPPWLAARWKKNWGAETAQRIALMHRHEPTLDLTVRSDPEAWAKKLGGIVLPTGSVRLLTHDPIPELAGYADGEWWVQDAAAAIPARLVRAKSGERVIDLCAAPGGKAAQLAAAGANVVALDRSAERMKRLAANFERLRLPVEIGVGDALSFDAAPFDAVLLDAPCTATGTIRRHPDVAWVKRVSDVTSLAAMQAKMLDRACALLKPGGRLVYSTCSIEPEEGEAQVAALLRRNPDMRREAISPNEIGGLGDCLTAEGDIRILPVSLPNDEPRLAGVDGFFASRLVRKER
jgi:16S rRNA (cytosine967-C5)-methyltransferase